MRTLSFFFFLIAIGLLGGWYWLSQQNTATQSTSPTLVEAVDSFTYDDDAMMTESSMDEMDSADLEVSAQGELPPPIAASAPQRDAPAPARQAAGAVAEALGVEQPTSPPANTFSTESASSRSTPAPAPAPVPAAPSELDNFKSRPIAYNRPPELLILGKPIDVSLIIDATDEADAAAGLEGFEGEIIERNVSLSDEVSAQLTGAAFDIELMSVERQRLSSRVQNRWQWRVTPTQEGEHMLVLEIFGYANGSSAAEPLDAYRDRISVEVKQLDKIISLAKSYEPVIGVAGGIAGMFSALFAFIRFSANRRRRKSS